MDEKEDIYRVSLPAFEGPLDLLLHLIKVNEIDIYDIPIALVTEQYLEYLDLMREFNIDIAGDYLVMAATLAYIKSRMLLPVAPTADGEEEEADPRQELVRRLLEYQRFKKAAEELNRKALVGRDLFTRSGGEEIVDAEVEEASLFHLRIDDFFSS